MILVDTNLLIYAFDSRADEHDAALSWLEGVLGGPHRVGLPWEVTMSFVRLVTNVRMFRDVVTVPQAWQQVQQWLSSPVAWVPTTTPDHAALVEHLLTTPGLKSDDVPDVHLAALALGHGLELQSHDSGFARFPNLRWSDPLRTAG